MTEHERLLEDFEDARFALLMEGVARKEGERLEALNKMLLENPEAAVPESLDRRCLEAIDRHFARERRRAGLRKTGKVLRLAAVIMGISVLLFTSAFALSEDFRVATMNLMLTVTEKYTQFDIREHNGTKAQKTRDSRAGFEYFQNIDIQWLPEGFAYTEGEYDWYAGFEKETGEWIKILIYDGHGSLNVDTENADRVENISINGNEGLCILKDDYIHIVTTDLENNIYIDVIASNELPEDDVKKFVENIFIDHSAASMQYFQNAKIGWIPEGFECTESIFDEYAKFENEQGDFFFIQIIPGYAKVKVDTEDPDSLENISINGNEGLCIVKYQETEIMLADLENDLFIEVGTSSGLSVETAKKIAENITIL